MHKSRMLGLPPVGAKRAEQGSRLPTGSDRLRGAGGGAGARRQGRVPGPSGSRAKEGCTETGLRRYPAAFSCRKHGPSVPSSVGLEAKAHGRSRNVWAGPMQPTQVQSCAHRRAVPLCAPSLRAPSPGGVRTLPRGCGQNCPSGRPRPF